MLKLIFLSLSIVVLSTSTYAHVILDFPTGGQRFTQGEFIEIEWHVSVAHELIHWDLWYSLDGLNGPWEELVLELPGGDSTQGSIHHYVWLVPDIESENLVLRVRQQNNGVYWEDTSSSAIIVRGVNCCSDTRGNMFKNKPGYPDISDLLKLVNYSFNLGSPPNCSTEANVDGSSNNEINIQDIVYLANYLFYLGPAPPPCP